MSWVDLEKLRTENTHQHCVLNSDLQILWYILVKSLKLIVGVVVVTVVVTVVTEVIVEAVAAVTLLWLVAAWVLTVIEVDEDVEATDVTDEELDELRRVVDVEVATKQSNQSSSHLH